MNSLIDPTKEEWVHTLGHHDIGSVVGWESKDSPTGWWSGIVIEKGHCSVKVNRIQPGIINR